MEYRRARESDFKAIIELQQDNLLSELSPTQLDDGFLNRAYTLEQLQGINESIVLLVAANKQICGYFGAATLEFSQQFAYPAALFKAAEKILYQGKNLTSYRCCLVNPMCIAKEYHGTEVFMGLCQQMLAIIIPSYEIALTFVARNNHRSLQACQKMMQICGQFTVEDKAFAILMRDLRPNQ